TAIDSPSCFRTVFQALHMFCFITLLTTALVQRRLCHRSSQTVPSPGHHLKGGITFQVVQLAGAGGTLLVGLAGIPCPRSH
uniref:Uncharacterized protein n=1 Tax=Meleagris gallopavo TaxID=9103 RepID=A0A803XVD9_MELGA